MKYGTDTKLGYGDYLRFRDMVTRRCGLYFPDKKRADLELGIFKGLENSRVDNLDAYYQFLNNDTSESQMEFDRLVNFLTIGETHFFRDTPQFDAIANFVLPSLIDRKREEAKAAGTVPQLRLWSAGCASGEEPYSLAILLHELIPDLLNWHILILGTDINDKTLDKARQAVYSDWSFRESRALALRSIYFTRHDKTYHLQDNIKRMVTFAQQNLIEDKFPAIHNNLIAMDMIICRNVMIYFATETVQELIHQYYETLVNQGWLIVGHSEPSLMLYRAFTAQTFPGTLLYQKTGKPTAVPDDWDLLVPAHTNGRHQIDAVKSVKIETDTFVSPALPRRTGLLNPAKVEPTVNEDPYHVALRLLSQGQTQLAITTLQNDFDKLPRLHRPYAHCLLARVYADQGKGAEARRLAELAITENNLLTEPYLILSMLDEHEGHLTTAVANLKKVIYLDSHSVIAHFNLGMLYQRQNQLKDARRAFRNAQNLLANQPPETLIPDSGETTVKRLSKTISGLLTVIGAPEG